MRDNLSQFLVDLASNPGMMAAFQADPDRICEEAGLDGREQTVIQSRDPRLISNAIGAVPLHKGHDVVKPTKPKGGKKKPGKKKPGGKKKR